jgi:hypothetical protein
VSAVTVWFVAAARVMEARVRRSRAAGRLGRSALAWLARRSVNARAFVRLRVMRMI